MSSIWMPVIAFATLAVLALLVVGLGALGTFAFGHIKNEGIKNVATEALEAIKTSLMTGGQDFLKAIRDRDGDGKIDADELKEGAEEFWEDFKKQLTGASLGKLFKQFGGEDKAKAAIVQKAVALAESEREAKKK